MATKKLWYQFSYKLKGKGAFLRYAHGYKKKVEMASMLKKDGVPFSVKKFEFKPSK
jgi:hypothetical protein